MKKDNLDFSSFAVGYAAVARISTASAQAALCAALGYFVDRRLETSPWGTLVGSLLGAAAFCVGLVLTVKRLERDGANRSDEAEGTKGTRSGAKRDAVKIDAEIFAESSKTKALREEYEETFGRASEVSTEKVGDWRRANETEFRR